DEIALDGHRPAADLVLDTRKVDDHPGRIVESEGSRRERSVAEERDRHGPVARNGTDLLERMGVFAVDAGCRLDLFNADGARGRRGGWSRSRVRRDGCDDGDGLRRNGRRRDRFAAIEGEGETLAQAAD